ncbi:hypothetical protein PF011_g10751 [Phytophthora fragariae]|uniref:Uncharacterized protein n=1 Tax=Phytophthora fragariae TaxID=53985 RepID=A0A6A3F1G3_9STRA|nr:hypothetical protein PF009_g14001 [Phytophthora fragariae]KAE9008353.1 hypothetical protein PF011_g10751 [Phytophthora fragariae]
MGVGQLSQLNVITMGSPMQAARPDLTTWLGPRQPLGNKACEAHAIIGFRQAGSDRLSKAHQEIERF